VSDLVGWLESGGLRCGFARFACTYFLRLVGRARCWRSRAGFRRCCVPARLAAGASGNVLLGTVVYVVLGSCMLSEVDWVDCKSFAANMRAMGGMEQEWTYPNELCRLIEEH